jgi:alanyl aminopeptidase
MGLGYAVASQLGAGTLSGDAVLQSLGGLVNDSHPRVVASSLSAIESVWEPLAFDAARPALRQWLLRTLTPVYRRFGPSVKPGEDVQITRLRPNLLAWLGSEARDPQLLALAKQQVPLVLENSEAIDPDLRGTFMMLAAVDGDEALFDAYRQKFESLSVPDEQVSYLRALGDFRDLAITRRALDYVLTATISPDKLMEIPRNVSNDQERQSIAWEWIRANYDAIAQRVPRFALSFMPFFAGDCSSTRLVEATAFFAQPAHNVPGTDRSLAQMAESVSICSTIRERERPAVKRFLDVQ